MIVSSKKIMKASYFVSSKTQGIINGGKICRFVVGCNARY
jgi:hypothetical protein